MQHFQDYLFVLDFWQFNMSWWSCIWDYLNSLKNIWHTYISWASVIGPLLVSFLGVMFLILCEPCILAHFSKHSLFPAFIDIFWQGKTITIVSTWSSGWPTGSLCGKVYFTGNCQNTMLCGRSQAQKVTYCMIPFKWNMQKR